MDLASFLAQFHFDFSRQLWLGVEREFLLVDTSGHVVPRARDVLTVLGWPNDPQWGPELSACQIEHRAGPFPDVQSLMVKLSQADVQLNAALRSFGLRASPLEVAPADMPLDTFPLDRYTEIRGRIPIEVLRSACRVAGTHIHVGVEDIYDAIAVYDRLIPQLERLLNIGDHSSGERIRLYKEMASHTSGWQPPFYEDADHFCRVAQAGGFLENPRDCYHFIRINPIGTVEVRAFGVGTVPEVSRWVEKVFTASKSAHQVWIETLNWR